MGAHSCNAVTGGGGRIGPKGEKHLHYRTVTVARRSEKGRVTVACDLRRTCARARNATSVKPKEYPWNSVSASHSNMLVINQTPRSARAHAVKFTSRLF